MGKRKITNRQRTVLIGRYLRGRPYAEHAAKYGVDPQYVPKLAYKLGLCRPLKTEAEIPNEHHRTVVNAYLSRVPLREIMRLHNVPRYDLYALLTLYDVQRLRPHRRPIAPRSRNTGARRIAPAVERLALEQPKPILPDIEETPTQKVLRLHREKRLGATRIAALVQMPYAQVHAIIDGARA